LLAFSIGHLGYADVSCYGRRDFTTPNIDRIAARGFLQGYANSAVCSATRLALITGRYQYRLRLGLEEPFAGNPEVGLHLTDQLGPRAVDAVNSYAKSGQPFLISLHFNAPHWPWEGPDDEAESKRLAGTSLRHFDGGTQKTYQHMIEAMDAQIGRVLDALDANGLTENTVVIFTSDNGGERFADTWPFTGKKTDLLEGGLRIPMGRRREKR
jgi:arylsulfatase A-like enzyme